MPNVGKTIRKRHDGVCAELHFKMWSGTGGRIGQGTVVYVHVAGSVEVVKVR